MGKPRHVRILSLVVAIIASLVVGIMTAPASGADTFTDPTFSTEVVATVPPFTLVGLAFAPDGRMFVWEKNGVVRVVKNGTMLPTPFIDLSAKVNTFDDRGFWGFAFDPDFASNGLVYMTYTYENTGNPNDQGPKTSRLVRVQADPAHPDVALAGSETVIMGSIGTPPCSAQPVGADCIPADAGSHTLGSVVFAPDGTMLVGVGDGSDGDALSLRAQDLNSINGKILRINRDGTAPTDNPFYDGTNSIRSKVWLYGVRNPFRFAIQPGSGDIWFGEVGWNTWEEVDRGIKGGNYGWPCYEGISPQPFFQSNFPDTCGSLSANAVRSPYYTYDHSQGSAAIGGPFYNATAYPQQYRGNFFFGDYSGNYIKRIGFDAGNNPTGVQPFATGVAAPVSMEVGPDGLIYYLSFTSGEIRRIRSNAPLAVASATPTYGYSPLTVAFSSAGSGPAGGTGTISYLWDFGDGATSTAANPSHTYTATTPTHFTPKLTVTGSGGTSASYLLSVTVGSVPPTPTITAPTNGTSVLPGQVITYQGSATDPEDGTLSGNALSWTVLLHHNTHVHTFVGGNGSSGSFTVEDHGDVGTFSYEIVLTATDSSGLTSSTSVTLPVGNDSTAPTVPSSLTATATGPSGVDLSWAASTDNTSVAGYRVERCQGAGCATFAQIATPTGTTYSDTALAPSTNYSYRVRAIDPSGNLSGYSATASATTGTAPTQPAGLVAGYTFDAGTGITATDSSGNNNTGALNGATWTTGKYGGALNFNGSNTVQIPSAPSLNLTTGMTLAAWIKPSTSQTGWRTIMQKQADAYFLNASKGTGTLLPAGGGTIGTGGPIVSGTTTSPVNAWTHIALTYDGTTMRLYVNGTQVSSTAATGTIQTTTNPLWIGGNSPYGEYFQGAIDEARVYNRALDPGEITLIRDNPILPPAPDTSAPTPPTGLTATAAGTQINLSWTASTDNVGVTGYRVERCQGAGCSSFIEIGTPTGTTFADPGLASSTSYSYRVRAVDAASNTSGYSAIVSATTATADTTAPTPPTNLTASASGSTQINLSWTASTDNVGVTGYRVERCQGAGCSSFIEIGTPTGTTFADPGLASSTSYSYRVRAVDAASNTSGYSAIVSATTATADTTAPTPPTNLTASASGSTQINLSWTASTDNVGVAEYRIERCSGASCMNFTQVATSATTSYANAGLTAGTTYRYRVRAADAVPNLSAYSTIAAATTAAASDTTAPSAPKGLSATAAGPTQVNLSWTASTDNVGVTGYRIERCQGSGCTSWAQVGTATVNNYADSAVSASTTYRYRVRATDAAGNLSGYSGAVAATTPAQPDITPPTAPATITATANGTRVDLSWAASTDNTSVAGYRVERCQGAGCATFAQIATPTGTTYSDTALAPSTNYSYRVRAIDPSGNLSGYSATASATTGTAPTQPAGLVAGYTFDAGTGITATDSSGNNNTGALNGATWTTGKYGGALNFNGSNTVQIPSAPSLNLTTGMTLAAWIKPSTSQTGWRTIMQKQADAYFLNASKGTGTLLPAGGGTIGTGGPIVSGTTTSPVNAWTHIALTYDGTTMRLYVNGTQVSSTAATGTIQTTTNPLWIGGNSPYGEYFQGAIDEARVYNRALDPGEIVAVRDNALS